MCGSHLSLDNSTMHDILMLPHLLYSPDLTFCKFFFVSACKELTEWFLLQNCSDAQVASKRALQMVVLDGFMRHLKQL
jgi:hypothetical protein